MSDLAPSGVACATLVVRASGKVKLTAGFHVYSTCSESTRITIPTPNNLHLPLPPPDPTLASPPHRFLNHAAQKSPTLPLRHPCLRRQTHPRHLNRLLPTHQNPQQTRRRDHRDPLDPQRPGHSTDRHRSLEQLCGKDGAADEAARCVYGFLDRCGRAAVFVLFACGELCELFETLSLGEGREGGRRINTLPTLVSGSGDVA